MFFESPLFATLSHSSNKVDEESQTMNGRAHSNAAPDARRRRAASTSSPLKSLCFSPEYNSILSNLDSIFNYLPTSPRHHRNSWNPASFKQFKAKPAPPTRLQATPTSPNTTPNPSTSSAIASLPTELLCLIFDSYLAPSPNTTADTPPDSSTHPFGFFSVSSEYARTPLPLTHVCRSWRHAAVAHRHLWSRIVFALGEGYPSPEFDAWARGKVQLLRLFIARARDAPLSIAFSTSVGRPSIVQEALQCISRVSYAWKDLTLQLGTTKDVEVFLDELTSAGVSTFGELQRMQLDLAAEDEDEDEMYEDESDEEREKRLLSAGLRIKDIYSLILRRAPQLSELVLDDNFFVWAEGGNYSICPRYTPHDAVQDYTTFWGQLKKLALTCNSISGRKVLDICSRATRLEELKAWRVGRDGMSDIDLWDEDDAGLGTGTVKMESLRVLDVTLLSHPGHLLERVLAPRLEKVDVDLQMLTRGFWGVAPGRESLATVLAPVERLLEGAHSSSVEVRCRIKESCVEADGAPCDAAWMEKCGLRKMASCGAVVDVYGKSRLVRA